MDLGFLRFAGAECAICAHEVGVVCVRFPPSPRRPPIARGSHREYRVTPRYNEPKANDERWETKMGGRWARRKPTKDEGTKPPPIAEREARRRGDYEERGAQGECEAKRAQSRQAPDRGLPPDRAEDTRE